VFHLGKNGYLTCLRFPPDRLVLLVICERRCWTFTVSGCSMSVLGVSLQHRGACTNFVSAIQPEAQEALQLEPDDANRGAMSVVAQRGRLNNIPAREKDEPLTAKVTPSRPITGFLLTDFLLNPISFNAEAIQILSYPEKLADLARSELFLAEKIRSTLISPRPSGELPFVSEFRSGRRRYFCRAFVVDSGAKEPFRPSMAILLERGPSGLVPLSRVCQQFKLTQREREVLEFLLQGMSSKLIASRMNLSPSTVKAFLRLIMIKTGSSSRSAMVGKILMTQP
jgi:DNA-binding CsgD family transcriptional regulator